MFAARSLLHTCDQGLDHEASLGVHFAYSCSFCSTSPTCCFRTGAWRNDGCAYKCFFASRPLDYAVSVQDRSIEMRWLRPLPLALFSLLFKYWSMEQRWVCLLVLLFTLYNMLFQDSSVEQRKVYLLLLLFVLCKCCFRTVVWSSGRCACSCCSSPFANAVSGIQN